MSSRFVAVGSVVVLLLMSHLSPLEAQRRGQRRNRGIPPNRLQNQQRNLNPSHERAKEQADQSYRRGEYERTVRITTTVILENPRDHVALYLRASARAELGIQQRSGELLRQAIADAREAIRVDDDNNMQYYVPYLYGMTNLAAIEDRKEHAEVAIQVADQLLAQPGAKEDERGHLLYQRARAHSYLKDFDAAARSYDEAIRLSPTLLGGYVALAETYVAAGEHQKALDSYGRAVDAFSSNPLVYNNRGMYLQQQGESRQAVADFTQAIEINDEYHYAYTNRGFALMSLGEPEAAESDYTAALRIKPELSFVYNMRGVARLAQGNVRGAIEDQRQVLRLTPRDPSAHANLGFALFFAEDYLGATKSFEQAVNLDAKQRHLGPWRYCSMQLSGQEADARTLFNSVIEKEVQTRDWVDYLHLYLLGQVSEDELLAAIRSTDEKTKSAQICEAHFFIGVGKSTAEDQTDAQQHFEKALATKATHLSAFRGAQFALKKFTLAGAP